MRYLDQVRAPEQHYSQTQKVLFTVGALMLGISLGIFSKYLDYRQAELPDFLMLIDGALDIHNFLGTFAPWIVLAVFLSVKSSSSVRAGINVFVFFAGMVASYYWYSSFVAGFFPKSYAMIWAGFTVLSPFLAFFCWYAKGKGWLSFIISAGILGFMINSTISYGMWYADIRSWLHLLTLILGIIVIVLNKSVKETACLLAAAIPAAVLLDILIPFGF